MMARRPKYDPFDLGREVLHLRAKGIAWKTIERIYGVERTTLWRATKILLRRFDDWYEKKRSGTRT